MRAIVRSEPDVQRTCACGGECADGRTEPVEASDVTVAPLTLAQLQRAPGAGPKRRDVALVGADFPGAEELARVLAPGGIIVPVSSVADVAVQLARLDVAIGTLYFVSHSAPDGALKLSTKEGLVKPADVATALRGKVAADKAPHHVDFRGCKVGGSPQAMDQIRVALGATSLVAGDCWIVVEMSEPIVRELSRKPVTKPSDVEPAFRPEFLELMKRTAAKFKGSEACIINRSEQAFFRAGGRFVALFFNPAFVDHWVPGKSVCYAKLAPQTVDPAQALGESSQCRLIQVEKPAANAPTRPAPGVSVPP